MKKLLLVAAIVLVACGAEPTRSSASSPNYSIKYLGSVKVSHRTIDVYCDPQAHVLIYAGVSEINSGGDTLAAVELTPGQFGECT